MTFKEFCPICKKKSLIKVLIYKNGNGTPMWECIDEDHLFTIEELNTSIKKTLNSDKNDKTNGDGKNGKD